MFENGRQPQTFPSNGRRPQYTLNNLIKIEQQKTIQNKNSGSGTALGNLVGSFNECFMQLFIPKKVTNKADLDLSETSN